MDATTTDQIISILSKLRQQSPQINFSEGDMFAWNPLNQTITYSLLTPVSIQDLLHEYGHAILKHTHYDYDIELLGMERDAWQQAKEVARSLTVTIDSDYVNQAIDTYRDWLHARSQCPICSATGVQTLKYTYFCQFCDQDWRVNDARSCQLRRYSST